MGNRNNTVVLNNEKNSSCDELALIKQFSANNNEPKWLTEDRVVSWDSYKSMLLPDRVSHLWKYSDPKWFEFGTKKLVLNRAMSNAFLVNKPQNNKIIFSSLHDALKNNSELVKKYFSGLTKNNQDKITTLNNSSWSNGYFLYIPPKTELSEVLHVKLSDFLTDSYQSVKVLIFIDEGSSVSLIDEISSSGISNLTTNVVTEIYLNSGSKLNFLNLQLHDRSVSHHLLQRAELKENSEFNNLIVSLGGKIVKSDLRASLIGKGASVTTYGIVLGDGTQKFDHHTSLEHLAPHTKSYLNFRVVLKDKATSAYTGNLKIVNEAVKSDACQENRNLLLSENAKAESIPELEILTNDVIRCSHGVTMGQVDKDQIYYLMSRGLNKDVAERLIVEGFIEPTISRIPDEDLKKNIILKINEKLGNK